MSAVAMPITHTPFDHLREMTLNVLASEGEVTSHLGPFHESQITPKTKLAFLGIKSLGCIEWISALDELFNITTPPEFQDRVYGLTFEEILAYVKSLQATQA